MKKEWNDLISLIQGYLKQITYLKVTSQTLTKQCLSVIEYLENELSYILNLRL